MVNIVGLGIPENLFQFGTVVSQIDSHSFGVHDIHCLQVETVRRSLTNCCGTLLQERACVGKGHPK